MKKIKELIGNPRFSYFLISVVILLIFYNYRWGLNLFNPTYINWVIDDVELANGFFSFGYFRYQEWGLPLGEVHGYFYPLGTNLYTSDIPLLALLFKPFSAFLPQQFQFIGVWYLASHLLQAWFTILLCERLKINGLTKLLVLIFFLFSPVMLSRYLHPTLFCQWMILAGFWIYFIDPEKTSVKKIQFYQLCLFIVSGLVFAYLWAMIFGFSVALFLRLWLIDKKVKFYQAAGYFTLHVGIMVSLWLLIGLISLDGLPNYQMSGWGQYSLNLNALYNPMGTSALMPTSPYFPNQELEGYNYLGMGVLTLIILCIAFSVPGMLKKKQTGPTSHFTFENINILPLLLFFIFSTIYALSNTITINNTVLFHYQLSGSLSTLTNSFRASGRFFWSPYYFILIFLFYHFNRLTMGFGAKNLILISCLALQLYDMQHYLKRLPITYEKYVPPINPVWERLINSYDNILFYPGFGRSYLSFDDYRYFTYYSVIHKKNINVGYPSRFDAAKVLSLTTSLGNKISSEGLDEHTLYISIDPYLNQLVLPLYKNEAYGFNIDGYLAIFKKTKSAEELSKFLEQNFGDTKRNTPALQLAAQPWNANVNSILTKNAKMGFYETDESENHFYMKGWAFYGQARYSANDSLYSTLDPTSKQRWIYGQGRYVPNDSLYLVLESVSKQKWKSPVSRFGTPDVVDYFGGKSNLAQSGFGISLVKNNLENGFYRTGLLFRNKKTKLNSLFWLDHHFVVRKPVGLVSIHRPSQKTSELQFSIYDIEYTAENISVECWAFPKIGTCTTCKPYFTLHSPTSFYGAEAITVPQRDVVTYFNDSSLLNTGLQATFKKSALPKGSYQLGILLRDTLNKIDYFSETDKLVHVGQDEFATPEEMQAAPQGTDTIRAFVDRIEDKEDFIQISGWSFINNVSTDFSEASLVLKSNDNLYSLTVTPVPRSDIQKYLKLSYNVDRAGISVKFKKASLKPGKYQVCIAMLNKKNNARSLLCLDTTVNILE